jgi:hypothetical protein
VRVSSLQVKHLLGVAVVRSDAENVTSLLAGVVNGLDGGISGRDSLDGGIVDTSVANLPC